MSSTAMRITRAAKDESTQINAFLLTASFGFVFMVGGLFFGWLMRINPSFQNGTCAYIVTVCEGVINPFMGVRPAKRHVSRAALFLFVPEKDKLFDRAK
ncbi:hypothetical protein ACFFSY_14705 [Paenibacillus aurantiacus]|uniref:Uncharacterized protein n=1 Tax=Paenibacillus aurantiacus TaxID=1936118 RepID=A0ABV5KPM7_9BACL